MKPTTAFFLAATSAVLGCSGAGGGQGTPGTGGAGGTTPGFMAVPPCTTEASYTTTGTTIQFGVNGAHTYQPACLSVAAGATVTFSGDFITHPLSPSASRGTQSSQDPIQTTASGTTASFTLMTHGFWAYTCLNHGSDADGTGMDGVIWAK